MRLTSTSRAILSFAIATGAMANLSGCSSSNSGSNSAPYQLQSRKVEGGKIVNLKGAGGAELADELVASAYEIAFGPGFMYTNEFLERALQLQPNHPAALYLKALMDWTPLAQGILTKAFPLFQNTGPEFDQTQRNRDTISGIPEGDYKTFVTKGGNQIYNEAQSQDFIASIEASLLRTRSQLQQISNLPDFSAPFVFYLGQEGNVTQDCAVTKIADAVFMIKDCPWKNLSSRKISFADVKATNLAVASYLTLSTLFSSYNFDGSLQLSKDVSKRIRAGERIPEREVIRLVRNQTQLLKLRSGHRLTDIIGFTNELTMALEEAIRLQNRLCRNGPDRLNRPGYLVESGFCIGEQDRDVVDSISRVTRGPIPFAARGWNWSQGRDGNWLPTSHARFMTSINLLPLLKGQLTDLKDFLPTGFNSCGSGTNISDHSLSGTFPNADFVSLVRLNHPLFLNPRPICQSSY